jgi:probable F420-dependent oxidoreductase
MKFGAVYPQLEFGADPIAIRDYAQTAEELGFSHILAYDHVLGVNTNRPDISRFVYNYQSMFQEPLVLFSYMAGVTETIGFATGIIILPQRQTALFAKQAATLDVLSKGRTRIGIGLGWNDQEYISLNENFHNRGRRIEEQIEVMRKLWTQPLVQYSGRWHTLPDVGINPLPVQQPIPLWFGGHAEPMLKRAARLADGWMPNYRLASDAQPSFDLLDRSLAEAGRSRNVFGLEARIPFGEGNPQAWEEMIAGWRAVAADYIDINTMNSGLEGPNAHIQALRTFAQAMGMN